MPKNNRTQPRAKRGKANNNNVRKEIGLLGRALRSLGGAAGGYAGGMLGSSSLGSSVGSSLGATVSKWLGSGDYSIKENSIVNRSMHASDSIPTMHSADQSIVVRHKEYLGPVLGNTNFQVRNAMPLNPGMVQTFPWLSDIAKRYQEYTFKGIVFHYIPTSGYAVSGTNPALGTVMMQTSYRATEDPPTSKLEILNEYWSTESVTSESFAHPIECAPQETVLSKRYVRSTDPPNSENKLFYDLGTTYLAVSGQPASDNPIGDLWVTYEVELRKPMLTSNATDISGAVSLYGTAADTANPLTSLALSYGDPGFRWSGRTITFPTGVAGWFTIVVVIGQVSGSITMQGALTGSNFTAANIYPGNARIETPATTAIRGVWQAAFIAAGGHEPTIITLPTFLTQLGPQYTVTIAPLKS